MVFTAYVAIHFICMTMLLKNNLMLKPIRHPAKCYDKYFAYFRPKGVVCLPKISLTTPTLAAILILSIKYDLQGRVQVPTGGIAHEPQGMIR